MELFRYQPIDLHALTALAENTLFYASANMLNDPEEGSFQIDFNMDASDTLECLKALLNRARNAEEKKISLNEQIETNMVPIDEIQTTIKSELEAQIEEYGIRSFTTSHTYEYMWSHYADQHRGLCIKYEIDPDYGMDLGLNPMIYSKDKTVHLSTIYNWVVNNSTQAEKEILKTILYTKSTNWTDEKEFRSIANQGERGRTAYKPCQITGIYFGKNVKAILRDKVIKIMYSNQGISFFKMVEKAVLCSIRTKPILHQVLQAA